MKRGYLSEYFEGVAVKRLSAVEADVGRSNQHEFNGVESLKRILGQPTGKTRFSAKFLYLTDSDSEPIVAEASITWYDARESHLTRSECRLYFPTTPVSQCTAEGDLLVIGRRPDNTLLVIIAESGSTIERQIQWLFGFSELTQPGFSVKDEAESDRIKIEFASRFILDQIGIEIEERDEAYLDIMLKRFGGKFPPTRDFSIFARETIKAVSCRECPDAALMAWMEREEILFRTLERHLVAERLKKGFGVDVDDFIAFSLSVHNRRKSRAGSALENHVENALLELGIKYSRGLITENKSRPDFIFPGITQYRDDGFPASHLTMLGLKASCKDRWRQVLAEADRIERKHLLTLEPGISQNQTNEMAARGLQLVLPGDLHKTYTAAQQTALMDFRSFVALVKQRQGQ